MSTNPEREHLPGADQASAPSNCSDAILPYEIVAVIMLGLATVVLVWWFDWRLGAAWMCKTLLDDYRKDFKQRKHQNESSSPAAAIKKD